MKIISISMNNEMKEKFDKAIKEMGLKGRSDAVRKGIKMLLEDYSSLEKIKGHAACILIVIHSSGSEEKFLKVSHKYKEVISTQLHNNFCGNRCIEILVLHGDAEKIKSLYRETQKIKKIEYSKLIVP